MIVWVLPLLVVVVAVASQLAVYPSPDVAWILYATREVLHGARVGTDILENTPPLIFALKLPFVCLAESLGVSLWAVWVSAIGAGAIGVIAIVRRLLPEAEGQTRAASLIAALLAATLLLLPAGDFGQREHATTLLVLPYVALGARRLRGMATGSEWAVLVGALAGVGIGIKPHFVVFMAGLVLLEMRRLGWRSALAVEHLTVVAIGVLYLVLVRMLAPGYFEYARTYGPLYQHFLTLPLWALPLGGEGVVPGLVALGCYVALRRVLARESLALADTLAVSVATFYFVAVLQAKGWRYHFLPSIALSTLLTASVVHGSWRGRMNTLRRIYLALGAGMLGMLAVGMVADPLDQLRHPSPLRHALDPNLPNLLPLVEASRPRTVGVFSSNIASSYPLILQGGARSAFRYPSLWPVIALYGDSLRPGLMISTRPIGQWGALERRVVNTVLADLRARSPGLLLVMRADSTEPGWGAARRFNYLQYFRQDPAFAAELDANYLLLGRSGSYDVLAWSRDTLLVERLDSILQRTPPPHPRRSDAFILGLLSSIGFLGGALAAWGASRPDAG